MGREKYAICIPGRTISHTSAQSVSAQQFERPAKKVAPSKNLAPSKKYTTLSACDRLSDRAAPSASAQVLKQLRKRLLRDVRPKRPSKVLGRRRVTLLLPRKNSWLALCPSWTFLEGEKTQPCAVD